MYKVTCITDGIEYVLHSPLSQEYKLIGPKLTMECNHSGTLEFQMPYNHPNLSNLRQMQSEIFVYESGEPDPLWVGRMLTSNEDVYKTGTATCEGILGYLLDSQIGQYLNQAGVRPFLQMLIDNHNTRTNARKHFRLGNVTVQDDNDYIYREQEEGNYTSTLDTINENLIGKLGGFLQIRFANGERFIDYIDTAPAARQTIRFGENLIDFARSIPSDTLATAIIPLGAEYETKTGSGDEEETVTHKLNITGYQATEYHPAGADYVYLPEAVARFGYIYKTEEWSDVTLQQNLYSKALARLREISDLYSQLDISAADLSVIDNSLRPFRVGESVRVTSPPHSVDQTYMVNRIEYDIADPGNTKLSLGGMAATYTRSISDREKRDVAESAERQNRIRELNDEIKTNRDQIEATIEAVQESMTETFSEDLGALQQELEQDLSDLDDAVQERLSALQRSMGDSVSSLQREIDDDVAAAKAQIEREIAEASDLLAGENGGNIVIDRDASGKPTQILVLNAASVDQATSMIVLNQTGFGFRTRASTSAQWGQYKNAWTIDGNLVAQFITAVGTVTAGSIGGWTIGENTISKQIDDTHSMTISAVNGIMFQSGSNILRINQTGIAFSNNGGTTWTTGWNVNGSFVAQFITAVGTVTAGSIGGWTIGENTISKTIDSTHQIVISPTNGISFRSGNNWIRISQAGLAFSSDNGSTWKNAWTVDGTLSADFVTACQVTTGKIAGWNIGETMFWNGSVGDDDYISISPRSGLQIGKGFSVSKYGEVEIINGEIDLGEGNFTVDDEGVLSAQEGRIGDWEISDGDLILKESSGRQVWLDKDGMTFYDKNGNLKAAYNDDGLGIYKNYSSGQYYFNVYANGTLEVRPGYGESKLIVNASQNMFQIASGKHLCLDSDFVELKWSTRSILMDTDGTTILGGSGNGWIRVTANTARMESEKGSVVVNANGLTLVTGRQTTSHSGNLYISGSGVAYFANEGGSSRKIKKDVKEIEAEKLRPERLYDIEVIQFKYKDELLDADDENIGKDLPGFIVEELDKIYPAAVQKDDPEESKNWTWSPVRIIPPMLKLIQDQHKELERLKTRMEDIERRVN